MNNNHVAIFVPGGGLFDGAIVGSRQRDAGATIGFQLNPFPRAAGKRNIVFFRAIDRAPLRVFLEDMDPCRRE